MIKVQASNQGSMFLKSDGSLWAMGLNDSGQLCDNSRTKRKKPILVRSQGVKDFALGNYVTFILLEDGTLLSGGLDETIFNDGTNSYGSPREIERFASNQEIKFIRHHAYLWSN